MCIDITSAYIIYVVIKGGWWELQTLGTEGQGTTQFQSRKKYSLTQISVPVGIGLKIDFSKRLNFAFEASEIGEGKEGEAYRKAVGEVEEQVAKYNERSARQTNVFIAASKKHYEIFLHVHISHISRI